MLPLILGGALVMALLWGPQLWTRWVLSKHAADRADCPGTGGELAQHLVERAGMTGVTVERLDTDDDHYDPDAKTIRLSPRVHDGRSITAVTVAAHEFGHALQDHEGHAGLRRRGVLVRQAYWFDRIGGFALAGASMLLAFTPIKGLGFMVLALGVALSLVRVVVHLVTLPVETDASFNKALPILERGGYLPEDEIPTARHILRACAMTYVASSLGSLLNLLRWLRR